MWVGGVPIGDVCHICIQLFQCVKEYLKVWITEGNVMSMRCPDGACKKQGVIGSPEVT